VIPLTPRQREVVELLIAGHRVAEIAASLHCTEATVRAHIAAVSALLPGPHPPMRRILVYGARLVRTNA
jgi:FixJ family two-component response regulator